MEFTVQQIAQFVGGTIEGNPDAVVSTFAKIEEGQPGAISFLSNPKYTHFIYDTQSTAVLIDETVELEHPVKTTLIRVSNAYECVARLLQMYEAAKPRKQGISPKADIAESATMGDNLYIGAFAVIGDGATIGNNVQIYPNAVIGDNAVVGDDAIIYPNVTIYHHCVVGKRVIIHAGAVIGADGFGFAPAENGYDKIPQIGNVVIEDDVEIGANTCIDRSTMGSTIIHKGVKLDNLIQVAHNVEIGENTVMAAQGGIAGSTKVGQWCMFGGQVGMAGHITIADKTHVGAQAGITNSIRKSGETIIGSPAWDAKGFMKSAALFRRLPDMYQQLNEIKKQLEQK
ncbi:MAG: UDP-3-O-(3-hydroxymyristoyl)glucosamine N-acyltransferase [Prevotella sp.]|nr:UDP-3-O-(3-hydroxymyristoyl)glucosamine N-acyltransferase [Prevotella sp.]MBQ9533973.1 UDP-3-O-(3-hydroxymyristoyl)glucosamine N-acyltransferase [Prevotella sp.]